MLNPSSAIARLQPLRRHRAPRREPHRFLTRADLTRIALSNVPPAQTPQTRRASSSAWTLYWRCHWTLTTTRAPRPHRPPPKY
ncbi:hypothetical protein [Actinomadura sp. BRA 177]|uniref:hypothetical protein n=1 Tax=Actinomadura sp. BRA 177 TaxID=2745202 RepID=UPI001595D45F|nr:hypothetical protein [Actinomadura sp. BRA 177]NVI86622.1 hypothetical protein [Actinomadura sp. BRA 177]